MPGFRQYLTRVRFCAPTVPPDGAAFDEESAMKRWVSTVAVAGLVVADWRSADRRRLPAVTDRGGRPGNETLRAVRRRHLDVARRDDGRGHRAALRQRHGRSARPSAPTRRPTNIGGYLWSTVTARDLGIIGADEARERIATTLDTLETLERNDASGMYYNWYDPATGAKLTTWPDSGDPVHPFLSTVDNGWLAAGAAHRPRGGADASRPGGRAVPIDGLLGVLQPRGRAGTAGRHQPRRVLGGRRLRTAASRRRCTTARARRRTTPATTTTRR